MLGRLLEGGGAAVWPAILAAWLGAPPRHNLQSMSALFHAPEAGCWGQVCVCVGGFPIATCSSCCHDPRKMCTGADIAILRADAGC